MNFGEPQVRDVNRIPRMLSKLEMIWMANPDWRFGQLIENVMLTEYGKPNGQGADLEHHCIFHYEDDANDRYLERALSTYGNPE